jgi:hypothetical protein
MKQLFCVAMVFGIVNVVFSQPILPRAWDPKFEADKILTKLVPVTASQVAGAHDAELVLVGDHAYIVAEVNDIKAGEAANWPFIYVTMSVVNTKTLAVERIFSVAQSERPYDNETLPFGACFVPRIIQKDPHILRVFFASEAPGIRQSQTWYIDFDLRYQRFSNQIFKAKIKTRDGIFDMQPKYLYSDAVKDGFKKQEKDAGMYIFDSFKVFEGKTYVALNNYLGRQNAVARLNPEMDTFEVIGHMNEPQNSALCEPAINRLPDGSWLAIIRQDGGNYMFSTSLDGRVWTEGFYKPHVHNGTGSKPTFDKFGKYYYMGWQEDTKIDGVNRSVFNIDISLDGVKWERKYRFETVQSFQYPTFREHNGSLWFCVTQGKKERIMFGKLEDSH